MYELILGGGMHGSESVIHEFTLCLLRLYLNSPPIFQTQLDLCSVTILLEYLGLLLKVIFF